jgi:hypothetical protein
LLLGPFFTWGFLAQAPQILLLNIELELKSEKENAEIRLEDPSQYQEIVDAGGWGIGTRLHTHTHTYLCV